MIAIVVMLVLYLILAGIIAVVVGRRLAKMSVEPSEKWDESRD